LKANFNVYHFFAGAFVPFWLLSRQEIGPGAKLTYAALAQQANSRGTVQLHFRVQAAALGEDEGQLSRHLMELEEVGLIQVSRGNVNSEDIRVFFPLHVWMAGLDQPTQAVAPQPAAGEAATPQRLFPEAAPSTQTPLLASRPAAGVEARPNGRGRRRGKGRKQPQSKHSFEVCLQFVTYQKEVLGHDHIWNATGLARHIHLSGEQDEEIDAYLAERASDAA
jgi:N-methylhydantoinase A/oxoprolinase/acetone carboxylase beta subunit